MSNVETIVDQIIREIGADTQALGSGWAAETILVSEIRRLRSIEAVLKDEVRALRVERDEERMAGHIHSKAADELAQTMHTLRLENDTLNKENQRLRQRWYETTEAERRAWHRLDEASKIGYHVLNTLTEERYLAHWGKDAPHPWTVHEHSLPLHTQRGFGKTALEALEMANRDPT